MRRSILLAASLAMTLASEDALAAGPSIGVVRSTLKVRPDDAPKLAPSAVIKAARNEVEAFQIVLRGGDVDTTGVSAKLTSSLASKSGAKIPDANVVLYVERYYEVGVPSNDEGASGPWPDPLVPDVDTYFGQKRNAFPLTVPARKTRVIWVDVLVPIDQRAGDYTGEIAVSAGGTEIGKVPLALHVGNFTLPSTATLGSAYGLAWGTVPQVHCGGSYPFCATEDAANAIRALYLRAGLDHRITLTGATFQPPFGDSAAPFEKYVLPLIDGTGPTRLPGAKLTTVQLDGGPATLSKWIAYAKTKGFADRLFYYPVDEPGGDAAKWSSFASGSASLHAADPTARICLTASLQDAQKHQADDDIDIFVPVLDHMYGRPGSPYAGDQRVKYDAWLAAKPARKLWLYQSCDQHGCGGCGTPSPGPEYTGWPQRVIDSSGVQDRAFGWIAWQERVSAELYFAVDNQLATAWEAGGQCAFSGSGDGTLFYPGKTSIVGGTNDIPIESIRLKLVREGMEDYEYLALVAKSDPKLARAIADGLFPKAYECAKTPEQLEAARDALFAALDVPAAADPSGGAGGTEPGASSGASGGAGASDASADADAGCVCGLGRARTSAPGAAVVALLGAIALVIRRRAPRPAARA